MRKESKDVFIKPGTPRKNLRSSCILWENLSERNQVRTLQTQRRPRQRTTKQCLQELSGKKPTDLDIETLFKEKWKPRTKYITLGPSFWKFNNSLLEDLRIKWDYIKYKIRQDSIKFSKVKASARKSKIDEIEGKLRACEEKVAEAPSPVNLEACKTVYKRIRLYGEGVDNSVARQVV